MPSRDSPPRLRLATHVDLSKAKNHERCNGTGISGVREIEDPERPGETIFVPVICRCITQNEGVKRDGLDRILAEIQQQLDDGTFGKQLARDIVQLPEEARRQKVLELQGTAVDENVDPRVRQQIKQALKELSQEA